MGVMDVKIAGLEIIQNASFFLVLAWMELSGEDDNDNA